MSFLKLLEAEDESLYGGKAVQLGAALRADLPVPPGFAVSHSALEQMLLGAKPVTSASVTSQSVTSRDELLAQVTQLLSQLDNLVAVRSSGVGEDSAAASFAGQHATILGVRTASGVLDAMREVLDSGRTESALAYRKKLGLDPQPKIGVVIQKLVRAEVAGVLFSRHPVTGADERVIEASWGLGEVVVQGLVTPDSFRVARGGQVLARTAGDKDLAIRWTESGGTREEEVEPELAEALCLDDQMLAALDALATRCEHVFGGSQDLEFAFAGGALYLLQRRAISRG